MRKNVGRLDAAIRGTVAILLVFGAAGFSQWAAVSIAFVVIAVALLRTALSRWCPLYSLLHIDTAHGGPKGRGWRGSLQRVTAGLRA